MKNLTLAELATITGGELHGDGTVTVSAVAPMDKAQEGNITFLSNVKYSKHLGDCKASAIMVKESERELCKTNVIVVSDPYVAFAKVAQALDTTPAPAAAIADSASISSEATIGQNVSIGANAVIESGVVLGDDVIIGAGCFIGKNANIGTGTKLWANVSVYHEVVIGDTCLIQSLSLALMALVMRTRKVSGLRFHKSVQFALVTVWKLARVQPSTVAH